MINFKFIIASFPEIIRAIPITLLMAFVSAIIGWILGFGIALVLKYKIPIISQICAVFVSLMRGVPMVILLYISYYALPIIIYRYGTGVGLKLDINVLPAVVYAIITLTIGQAAYASEIFRSALAAIDESQMEAACSVGMTRNQGLQRIVFPQALVIAVPNLGGLFIELVKGTSLAYYVGVYEITATANLLAMPSYNFIEAYIITTVIYEVISFIFNFSFRKIENRLRKFRTGIVVL